MKHIGIMGGSFNPPTLAHLQLAKFVLSKTDLNEIWLMPCHGHCLKDNLIDSQYRYDMCRLACIDEPDIIASHYEIVKRLDGSVFNLLNALSKDYFMSDNEFKFIIGADNVVIFDKWRNAENLKQRFSFITVPRRGIVIPDDITWYKERPHIFLDEKDPIIEVSATEIRRMLYKWWHKPLSSDETKELNEKVDKRVLKYIENHSLYMGGEDEQRQQGRVSGIS